MSKVGAFGSLIGGLKASEGRSVLAAVEGNIPKIRALGPEHEGLAERLLQAQSELGATGTNAVSGFTGLADRLADVPLDAWAGSAIKGAMGFGAFGGISEWSQGGSFWEGAKSGAWRGAFAGAGFRAVKQAPFAGAYKNRGFREAIDAYRGDQSISKQVMAISRAAKANRQAEAITKRA